MSLLTVIIVLVVVGVVLWLLNAYVPMDPTVKKILNIVVILVLVIWLLKAFGIWGELSKVRVENNRVVHPAFLVSDVPRRTIKFLGADGQVKDKRDKDHPFATEFMSPEEVEYWNNWVTNSEPVNSSGGSQVITVPTNTVFQNNHIWIAPDVEVANKNGKMYYQRKKGGTGVIFELHHSTNVVINGKSGGYFTEIQFPDALDDPGTLIRPSRGGQ